MEIDEKGEFAKVLFLLGEIYRREVTEILVSIYWKIFSGSSLAAFQDAVSKVMTETQFFPTPAIIMEELNGSKDDSALLAWEQVTKAMRYYGAYESILFEDGKIGHIIESFGGWPQFCSLTEEEINKFKRYEFIKLYKCISERDPKLLTGILEIQNQSKFGDYKRDPKVMPARNKKNLKESIQKLIGGIGN